MNEVEEICVILLVLLFRAWTRRTVKTADLHSLWVCFQQDSITYTRALQGRMLANVLSFEPTVELKLA